MGLGDACSFAYSSRIQYINAVGMMNKKYNLFLLVVFVKLYLCIKQNISNLFCQIRIFVIGSIVAKYTFFRTKKL
jgi:hypothetical protein